MTYALRHSKIIVRASQHGASSLSKAWVKAAMDNCSKFLTRNHQKQWSTCGNTFGKE